MKTAIMLLLLFSASLLAQRSDLETVRTFERRARQLSTAVDSAGTVQECADIRVSLEQLRVDFAGDKELLDKSLYGENFDQRLERISGQLMLAERKIGVIETHITRIVDLETQVRKLSSRVELLTTENTKLLSDIDRMSDNIRGLSSSGVAASNMVDSLRKVVGRLRQNLAERDRMIFALVDSLFMQYDKDISMASSAEMQGMAIKLDRSNVISGVTTSIENNIRFLDRTELTGSDLASILREHSRFSSQWKGIGPKLTSIYLSRKQRTRELAQIDTLLSQWSMKAEEAKWRGLNHAFQSRGMPVTRFSTGGEFVGSLTSYLDSSISAQESADILDTSWVSFERLWDDEVSGSWISLLVERGDITLADSAALAEKVAAWRSAFEPTSPFIYALIFVVIVGLLAVAYTWFIRNKPVSAP